ALKRNQEKRMKNGTNPFRRIQRKGIFYFDEYGIITDGIENKPNPEYYTVDVSPQKSMRNTMIFHLGQVKLQNSQDANFDFEKFCLDIMNEYMMPHIYTQIAGTDIIITNDKSKLEPQTKYNFYPIIEETNKYINEYTKDSKSFKYYDELIKNEIIITDDVIEKFDYIFKENPNKALNFSKFKNVSNIIEHIFATEGTSPSNITYFYRLAYNLGAFSQDEQTRTRVCNFLQEKLISGELNLHKMYNDYQWMQCSGEKNGFAEYYIKNFTKLNKKDAKSVCDIYNEFDKTLFKKKSENENQK
ncbi:MAG: hypothetical protein ACI4TX_03935, partial [Christensenellales bacterium]